MLSRNNISGAKRPALAYLRTCSSTNFGEEKDSGKRQWAAIQAYAKRAGFVILRPLYSDSAVSGPDPIDSRPGFAQMFAYLLNHADVRTILVESPQHFARDLIARETGFRMLKGRGIDLVAVDHPESFTADTPLAMMVRQILGAVHQFQRTMLVSQLRAARERKRALHGKCQVSRAGH
jgi:DNA invertase Pin-like site-specific DNA recombinase